jgi:hypothetical protein
MKPLPLPLFCLFLIFGANSAHSQAIWTGDVNSDFNTAGNWENDILPNNSGDTQISKSGANVTMSAAYPPTGVISNLWVGGSGTAPTLNISHNLSINTVGSRTLRVAAVDDTVSTAGVVNHTAGTLSAQRLFVGAGIAQPATGITRTATYNFTGGAISLTGDFQIGEYNRITAAMNMSGNGSLTVGGIAKMNRFAGDASLSITGGNLTINFNDGFTIMENTSNSGSATINATIDGTGFSTINVTGDVLFNNIADTTNRAFFNLALGSGYVHTLDTVFTVINATGNFTGLGGFGNVANNDILTVGGNEFRANYVTGTGTQFTLTAIPEPATVTLLVGFLMIGLLAFRRFQK